MDLPKITLRDFVEDGSIRQLDADKAVERLLKQVITVGYYNENGLARQLELQLPPTMELPRELKLAVQQAVLDCECTTWTEAWQRAWTILSKGATRDEIIGLAETEYVADIFLRRYLSIKGLIKAPESHS